MDAFSASAEPHRRRILQLLASRPRTASEVATELPVTTSAVSQHLLVLVQAGLVEADRVGRERVYRVRASGLRRLQAELERLTSAGARDRRGGGAHLGGAASRRSPYHHRDLRSALIQAAGKLAASGGPDAIRLRAAAREAGVSGAAVYRHFASHAELLEAARHAAYERMGEEIARLVGEVPSGADPVDTAVERLKAAGRGYVCYALAEPGLFRTAFWRASTDDRAPRTPGRLGTSPFEALVRLLDDLVTVGYLPAERRPGAEVCAWSAVHGLAVLLLDALADTTEAERLAIVDKTVEMVVLGLPGGIAVAQAGWSHATR